MTYNELYDLKPFGVNAVDSDNSPKSGKNRKLI